MLKPRFKIRAAQTAVIASILLGVCQVPVNAGELTVGAVTQQVSAQVTATQTLADGIYNLDYTFKKFNTDDISVMQDYVLQPAQLIVKGGKQFARITLKQSKEITSFKMENNGVLQPTEVVDTDEDKNTRTVQFELHDVHAKLKGWVKIYWQVSSTFLYDHEYDIHLTFDPTSIKPLSAGAESKEESQSTQPVPTAPTPTVQPAQESQLARSGGFSDLQGHPAQAAVERAVSLGIVSGYEDGTFKPNGSISRGEFTVLLHRAMKLETSDTPFKFADHARIPAWVQPYLATVVGAGIIQGYADGTFKPSNSISRAELAVMLVRAAKLDAVQAAKSTFADAAAIPAWAKAEIQTVTSQGMMQARTGNSFAPLEKATRAETVSAIMAMLDGQAKS